MRRSASSAARNPFAEEIATGRPPFPWAWPVRATAATAAAVPSSLRLESLTRAPARRRARPSSAQPQVTGEAQARHFRADAGIVSSHCGQLFVAGAGAGFSRNALASRKTTSANDEEVDHASGEIAVLDRILARERELRRAPLAARKDEPDHGH